MSEQSLELLSRIRGRLNAAARRITLADVLFGLVLTVGVCCAVWVVSAGIEAGFWLDTLPRTVLFWSAAALSIGLLAYFLILPLLRLSGALPGPSSRSVAGAVSDRFPQLGDRLINLLDLSEGRRSDAPDALVDRAVQMLGREVEPVPIEDVEDFGRAKRAARLAAIPLLAAIIFLTAAPSTFIDASRRLLSPGVRFEQPAPFRLVVEPGSIEVARGSSMTIRIEAQGTSIPKSLLLAINNLDEEHVEEVRLTSDSGGVFVHEIANVRKPFRYRVQARPVTSDWYRADVTEHPMVRSLQVTLNYPRYSGIPPQRLDANVGDVTGLPGSRANLEVALGGSDASNAYVRFADGGSEPLEIDDNVATGGFTLARSGSYQIILENEKGVQNRDPINYSITLVSDAAPSIVLIRPESDALLSDDLQQNLETRISDDYGFHDLTLFYRLAESRFGDTSESFSRMPLPLDSPRSLDQDVRYNWALTKDTHLDPVPGDVIEYYVRVRDNDTYAGYKPAETPVQRLRLPSLAEQYERLNEEQDEVESEMEDAASQAQQIRDQFEKLRDEIRRKQDADWEDKRQIEQLQQQQQQLEQRVDDLSRQVDSMNESAQQNNLLSEETLEMYQEMQKVVEEINSPELMEALRKLQEAVEQLNLQEMEQAIEDFEFNEEQYQSRLERALELFKNLRTQQALEEAARRAEELAKQQERLAEETSELMKKDPEADRKQAGEEEDPSDKQHSDEGTEGESDEKTHRDESEDAQQNEAQKRGESDQKNRTDDQRENSSEKASESKQSSEQNNSGKEQESGQQSRDSRRETLAREQELSSEEMKQLEKLLDELQKQVQELKKGPSEQMNQLNESVKQQQLPQEMKQNADQLRQNQLQNAQSGQQQMQQQLRQLQNQLSQMQSGMQGSQMQVNLAGLRRSLSDILTLSKQQEDLREGLRNNVSEAPSLRADAREQVELSEGLSTVIDSLQKLAANIPQMSREVQRQSGQALREMGQATEAMTDRSVAQAAGHQKASMMHLNELALLLSEVMNQLMNQSGSGSGSGSSMQQMIQQMQQTAQQQQKLNQQIQQFLNDMQGNRLSMDAQQRLQQMAAQQQAIKKQLDEIRRNPEARGNLLGDLERIGQQMEETISELQRRQVEPRMIERQQQILQRLLDAQRSIHQRGKEDRRQAQEGRDFSRESPDDLPPEDAAEKLRRDLIRALESGYAPDYEELIKRYFELLQQRRSQQE